MSQIHRLVPVLLAVGSLGAQQAGPGLALPPSPLTATQKATHALNRLAYGPRPGDVEGLARGGDKALADWIRLQLEPARIADAPVEARVAGYKPLGISIPELQSAYPRPRQEAKEAVLSKDDPDYREKLRALVPPEKRPVLMEEALVSAKLVRAVESERQLQEVLADFWFNHFNVDIGKGEDRWFLMTYEREALRPHLFGRFRDLVLATSRHPAMLWYLDNWLSVKEGFEPRARGPRPGGQARPQGLNENYARELMELHTLGVDGGYSQGDVREVARCFTGWGLEKPREAARPIFRPAAHDTGPKTVLGVKIVAGGPQEAERVVDLLCRQPACARYIATKLCRRFVSDAPPAALVDRVATRFRDTDGDLRQVYVALFTAPEFWSREALAAKVKTPLEFTASGLRALGGRLVNPMPLSRALARMGQPLYHCQPPTGYKDVQGAWVNTGALVNRIRFGVTLAQGRLPGAEWPKADLEGTLRPYPELERALPALAERLLPAGLGAPSRDALLVELKRDEDPGLDGRPRPWDRMLGLLLGSPEFQRK